MKMKKTISTNLEAIFSEEVLRDWVGEECLAQAKGRLHNVGNLRQVTERSVVASVLGGGDQVTFVEVGKDGEMISECTCSAGCDCVHAAMVALVWGNWIRQGNEVPVLDEKDERLHQLDGEKRAAQSPLYENAEAVKALSYLESLEPRGLFSILLEQMEMKPHFLQEMTMLASLQTMTNRTLISETKRQIRKASKYMGHSDTHPDYSLVSLCFRRLMGRGLFEALLDCGELLANGAAKLLRHYYMEDPKVEEQVMPCIALALQALSKSDLPDGEKLLWDYSIRRMGRKTLFQGLPSMWDTPEAYSKKAWSYVVDQWTPYSKRKGELPYQVEQEDFDAAHGYSGREDDIYAERIKNVDKTLTYVELATSLYKRGRFQDAEEVCRKGIRSFARRTYFSDYVKLYSLLEALYREAGNALMEAYFAIEVFLHTGTFEAYENVRNKADVIPEWPKVNQGLQAYLRSSRRPAILKKVFPDTGLPSFSAIFLLFPLEGVLSQIHETE